MRQVHQRVVRRAVDPGRAHFERYTPIAAGVYPAADAIAGFDHAHRPARVGEAARGRQPRHPRPDDEHRSCVRWRWGIRRAGGHQPPADHARRSREELPTGDRGHVGQRLTPRRMWRVLWPPDCCTIVLKFVACNWPIPVGPSLNPGKLATSRVRHRGRVRGGSGDECSAIYSHGSPAG